MIAICVLKQVIGRLKNIMESLEYGSEASATDIGGTYALSKTKLFDTSITAICKVIYIEAAFSEATKHATSL